MTWPVVTLALGIPLLVLLAGWLAFVGVMRWRALTLRHEIRRLHPQALGASLAPDALGDAEAEEAFRESAARMRGRFERGQR